MHFTSTETQINERLRCNEFISVLELKNNKKLILSLFYFNMYYDTQMIK
jgi:hypothetical protein